MNSKRKYVRKGVTFAELVVVLVILSLFLGIAMVSVTGLMDKYRFRGQANELLYKFQRASTAASEKGGSYEVIIDLSNQTYMVREITTGELSEVLDEEILLSGELDRSCYVSYVQFDDNTNTDEEHQLARFRVGASGWQYGGKVVLEDMSGRIYSLVISRISRVVRLVNGDMELLMPRSEDEMQL